MTHVARSKYYSHRGRAKERGIAWELTYVQWRLIWAKSGHWHERGRKQGQYQMARFGDKGPYAPWNVRIITVGDNMREARLGKPSGMLGKKHTPETRQKISKAKRGKPSNRLGKKLTLETRRKMSKAKLGKKLTLETRQKISKVRLGKKHTPETRRKISKAILAKQQKSEYTLSQ